MTGARDEVVIDASPGFGEAVVAGLVTPDYFVLRRRWLGRWGWRIVEYRPGRWEVVIRPRAEGGTERLMSPVPTAARPVLPERVLWRLTDLGVAIERFFGRLQDIEWAWAGVNFLSSSPDRSPLCRSRSVAPCGSSASWRHWQPSYCPLVPILWR